MAVDALVPHEEGLFVHVAEAAPLLLPLAVSENDTVGAPESEGGAERLARSEGVSPAELLAGGEGELLAEAQGVADAEGREHAVASALTEGECEAEVHAEPLTVSVHEREDAPLAVPLALPRAEGHAEGVSEGEPETEVVAEALGVAVARDAVAQLVALPVTVHERVGAPLVVSLGVLLTDTLCGGVTEGEAETEGEGEGVFVTVGERVPGTELALTLPLSLPNAEPLREAELHGDTVPVAVGTTDADEHTLAQGVAVESGDALPVAAPPVLLPAGVGVGKREEDACALAEGEPLPLAAPDPVAPMLPLAPADAERLGEPLSDGEALCVGVAEEQAVTLHDALSQGEALGEPVGELLRREEAEAEPLRDAEGEALEERHRLGEGVPVGDCEALPVALPLRGGVALGSSDALPEAVTVAEPVGVRRKEGEPETEAHTDTDLQAVELPLTLVLRDAEALPVPEAPREFEAGTVNEGSGDADALGQPLTETDREGVALPERQLLAVREGRGEALSERAPLAVREGEPLPEGVPLPALPVSEARSERLARDDIDAQGVGVPVAHGVADALLQAEAEVLCEAVRDGEVLLDKDALTVAVAVAARCGEGVSSSEPETVGQPELLRLEDVEPLGEADCEGQLLPVREGAPVADEVTLPQMVVELHGEGEGVIERLPQAESVVDPDALPLVVAHALPRPLRLAEPLAEPVAHTMGDALLQREVVAVAQNVAVNETDTVADGVPALDEDCEAQPVGEGELLALPVPPGRESEGE